MKFTDRVAVVTGAGSGIGRHLAFEAGRRGMRVAAVDFDSTRLAQTMELLHAAGVTATQHVVDVSNPFEVEALAEAVYAAHRDVHIVFNNAGVHDTGLSWTHTAKQWEKMFGINLMGVVNGINAFLPRMLAGDQEGVVVNTSSIAGLAAFPFSASYAASKHAVVAITECMHHELLAAGSKLRVALICPGAVATDIAHSAVSEGPPSEDGSGAGRAAAEFRKQVAETIRAGMSPADHARFVFDELEDKQFWIISDRSYLPLIKERVRSIEERRAPTI